MIELLLTCCRRLSTPLGCFICLRTGGRELEVYDDSEVMLALTNQVRLQLQENLQELVDFRHPRKEDKSDSFPF